MMYFVRLFFMVVLALFSADALSQSLDGNIRAAKNVAAAAAKNDPNAQPDTVRWKKWGNANLGSTQTMFWDWLGGGEPTITFNSNMSLFANYKKNKFFWENNAYFSYGIIKKDTHQAVKNDDQINIGSRIGYQMANKWYYALNFIGKTQFSPGYRYSPTDTIRISDFLAPASIYLSLGLDYKPSSILSVHISPLMGKSTYVRSSNPTVMATAGLSKDLIDAGKHVRNEFGGGLVFNLNGNFMSKKVTYNTQLELFSNYLEEPSNIDANWNFTFSIALAKHISASVRIDMIYDDNKKTFVKELVGGVPANVEHGAKLQVKEFFQINFAYNF